MTAAVWKLNHTDCWWKFGVSLIDNCGRAARALESSSLLADNLKKYRVVFALKRDQNTKSVRALWVFYAENLFNLFYEKLPARGEVFTFCPEEDLHGQNMLAF